MVPTNPKEIPPAIDAALNRVIARLRSDADSLGRSRHPAREEGLAALDALHKAADAVRSRLANEPSDQANDQETAE